MTSRRQLPRARLLPRLALVLAAVLGGGCRGGCRGEVAGASTAAQVLAQLPPETRVVIGLDFARLRRSPLWTKLAPLATGEPADRERIQEFARRTGLDPLSQIDSLMVAFPEQASQHGEMALVVRAGGLDETRLLGYVRDQVVRDGDDLFSFVRGGHTLWATRSQPTTAGFFPDARTLVVGAGGWAERMAALPDARPSSSAAHDPALVRLVDRAGPGRALWAAAIVPAATRAELAQNPDFASAAAINHLAASIDVGAGIQARLVADLATSAQAGDLAQRVETALKEAKRSPQALLLGVAPHLDGVRVRADGTTCEISVELAGAEALDLAARLRSFLALLREGTAPGFPRP